MDMVDRSTPQEGMSSDRYDSDTPSEAVIKYGARIGVFGPPGSGKSVCVLAWAVQKVKTLGWRVLWFHYGKDTDEPSSYLYLKPSNTGGSVTVAASAQLRDFAALQNMLYSPELPEAELLIVDGVLKEKLPSTAVWTRRNREAHIVWVSSQGADLVGPLRVATVYLKGWSKAEIFSICSFNDFWDQIRSSFETYNVGSGHAGKLTEAEQRTERIEAKYFVGGASVRYMFDYSIQGVKSAIDGGIATMGAFPLAQGMLEAVNRVFTMLSSTGDTCTDCGRQVPVSEYAAKQLAYTGAAGMLAALTNLVTVRTDDAALEGKLFALDQHLRIRIAHDSRRPITYFDEGTMALQVNCKASARPNVSWHIAHIIAFDTMDDLQQKLIDYANSKVSPRQQVAKVPATHRQDKPAPASAPMSATAPASNQVDTAVNLPMPAMPFNGVVLRPTRSTQGCYDFVYLQQDSAGKVALSCVQVDCHRARIEDGFCAAADTECICQPFYARCAWRCTTCNPHY
jgi:hypothetical protein